jgi:hypothetical protein
VLIKAPYTARKEGFENRIFVCAQVNKGSSLVAIDIDIKAHVRLLVPV